MNYRLEYNDFFKEDRKPFFEYLDGIDKKLIFNTCAYLLTINSNNIEEIIDSWFCFENFKIKEKLKKVINEIIEEKKTPINIINKINTLQLFEYASEHLPEIESNISTKEFEIKLLKAFLSLNSEENGLEILVEKSIKEVPINQKIEALILTQTYHQFDIINSSSQKALICQIVKAVLLFEFMESFDDKTQKILDNFCQYFGVKNWKEYFKWYLPIVKAIFKEDRIDGFIEFELISDSEDELQKHIDFFEKISIVDEFKLADFDFLSLREKPLFKHSDNKYKIIFPLFIIEKVFQGLYFLMAEINKQGKYFKNFKSFYCDEFSEQNLVYKLLNLAFPDGFLKVSGEEAKTKGEPAEPDFYIRNKNNIFLFEAKDVLIRADIKQSHDYNQLIAALTSKFYYSTNKKGKRKNEAILQLLESIRKILGNKLTFDKTSDNDIKIYPILLTHYKQYNTLGLNKIVNRWFKEELSNLENKGLDTSNVKDLIIIDIDVFILFQKLFKTEQVSFESILDQYISNSNISDNILDTMLSFYHFMLQEEEYNNPDNFSQVYEKYAANIFK